VEQGPFDDAWQRRPGSDRPAAHRRAPRLGPDQLIAAHITRLGRFRKLDPRKARKLPSIAKVAGVVAWGVFLEETFRRARRAERGEAVAGD
jgi:hypothetical protein